MLEQSALQIDDSLVIGGRGRRVRGATSIHLCRHTLWQGSFFSSAGSRRSLEGDVTWRRRRLKAKPITQLRSQLGHRTSCVSVRPVTCVRERVPLCVCVSVLVHIFTVMHLRSGCRRRDAEADQCKHCCIDTEKDCRGN